MVRIDFISIIESMNIHPSMKAAWLLFALLIAMSHSTTQDDDEVDTIIPDYSHRFFSGSIQIIQDTSKYLSPKQFTTLSSTRRMISPETHS
jgi:hypothetical protein